MTKEELFKQYENIFNDLQWSFRNTMSDGIDGFTEEELTLENESIDSAIKSLEELKSIIAECMD